MVGQLFLPAHAKSPLPALILNHGSAGLTGPQGDNIRKWAATLNDWGIAAFVVDSFRPRGIGDTATDHAPMLFLHGDSDNIVPVGPTREFTDWIQTQGNAVTFHTYPGVYHDFDVENGIDGSVARVETARNCDIVVDASSGQIIRMNHETVNGVSGLALTRYMCVCMERGADLHPNAVARTDALQKVHIFLNQALHIPN